MLMQPIELKPAWDRNVVASLLRTWAAQHRSGEGALPGLVESAAKLGMTSLLAVALGSVFRLTEACLGRPVNLERCCTPDLSGDARAVIHMLSRAQSDGPPAALRDAPPGLFNALASAVASARWLLSKHERQPHAPGL